VSGFETDPDHLRRSGGMLSRFGQTVGKAGEKLEGTGQHLVEHASGDRSGVGSVVAKFSGRAMSILGKVFQQGGRVADKAGQNLHKTGDLHEGADREAKDLISRQHPDNKSKHLPGGSTRTASAVTSGGKESTPKKLPGGDEHKPEQVGEGSGGKKDKDPHFSGDLSEPAGPTRISSADMPPPSRDTTPRKLANLKGAPGVVTDDNGLITHVGDKTADGHLTDIARHRANQYREAQQQAKNDKLEYESKLKEHEKKMETYRQEKADWVNHRRQEAAAAKEEGREPNFRPEPRMPEKPQVPASAANRINDDNVGLTSAAMDRRTGLVYEGINGKTGDVIKPADLHPTLRKQYEDMINKPGGYPVEDTDSGATRSHPHPDVPLSHAEVKAVNALLWERERMGGAAAGYPTGPSALEEISVDNYKPFRNEGIEQTGCCANCHFTLHGVHSNAGSYDRFPPGKLIPGKRS